MPRKSYAGNASATTLSSGINNSVTSIAVTAGANLPAGGTYPFVVVIDLGTASEEKVLIQSRSANTLTVAASGRGYDGTTAVSHSSGATVNHVLDANTVDEANDHVNTTTRDDHTQYHNNTRGDLRYPQGFVVPYSIGGVLVVSTGVSPLALGATGTILGAVAAVGTAPTGASLIVDIKKNGTTIYTTTANRPTIAAAATISQAAVTPDIVSLTALDKLTVDVVQVGSTVAGSNLTVSIRLR